MFKRLSAAIIIIASAITNARAQQYSAYLFAYFTGTDEALHYAISTDGYHFTALNGDKAVLSSQAVAATGGIRDPHMLRGADGKTFYMVATDMHTAKNGWGPNHGMVLLTSTDLVNWVHHTVDITKRYPEYANADRVWAPQTIVDTANGKYMVYWAMKLGKDDRDKIYYAYANKDFSGLEGTPKVLFNPPGNTVSIDADIIPKDGVYHLFFKHAFGATQGIKQATSKTLTGGYVFEDKQLEQTKDEVEGSGVFKLNDGSGYILMYDVYGKGRYEFARSTDLEHFTAVTSEVSMNFKPRHGTVIPITSAEAIALTSAYLTPAQAMLQVTGTGIKKLNVNVDSAMHTLYLPLKPGTNAKALKPAFSTLPGVTIKPNGKATGDGATYTVAISGQQPQAYTVKAFETRNPVLDGYYADPEVLYSKQTGKYYIYPTSDGFTGWSGYYFKVFSSTNLVDWKDEGNILELGKDVTWANSNAWAPCIEEKMINGQYKYFYYFCAHGKIGVAVADKPTGPFKDSGKPLLDKLPEGATHGQQIDPDVFTDPVSNKTYLYWGNGYMAVAELADDMVSLVPGTTKTLTPVKTYNEGTYVFYRKGKYYFMWSENDTRDPNYQVRYATASSPTGPLTVPANNLVIAKDTAAGIYGTGHNSILQIPGTDEWYIVYHRFNYPNGITMGDAAGYNREVCIDKLTFNANGTIIPVKPTQQGIKPLNDSSKK